MAAVGRGQSDAKHVSVVDPQEQSSGLPVRVPGRCNVHSTAASHSRSPTALCVTIWSCIAGSEYFSEHRQLTLNLQSHAFTSEHGWGSGVRPDARLTGPTVAAQPTPCRRGCAWRTA